ncbi:hypothetical protein MTO96_027589 [Rhipicephalus appendiculatus]
MVPDDDDISPPLDDHMPELFQSTMTLKGADRFIPSPVHHSFLDDHEGEREGRSLEFSFMFCAIFVALGILACVVAVLTVVNTGESFDEDEPTDKGKDGGESEPRVSAGPSGAEVVTVTPPAPTERASTPFAPEPTDLHRERKVHEHEHTCRGTGLCDIIFYESFYTKNKPTGWTDPGLDHFLELATKLRATSIGASFSPYRDRLFMDARNGSLNAAVDRLRRLGVTHFGALSLYGKYTMPPKLHQCLKILQPLRMETL